ncbi:SH3 domain-containing protein [Pantoea vagans]|nr:SH3 domain-containing protein [Pantoea jilinensis]TPD96392.1 SH3 domain-containing protein [Pantoea vagans]
MEHNMKKMAKLHIALGLMFVFSLAGCKTPPKMTDDTLVTSTVDGVALSHRYAVKPPAQFSPINETYRALYPGSVMSQPGYGGKVVETLKTGESYTVIGQVENNWLALGEPAQAAEAKPDSGTATVKDAPQSATPEATVTLTGYVPFRAVVKSDLYDQTVKADQPKRRARSSSKKKTCVAVNGDSTACQNSTNGTWIIN